MHQALPGTFFLQSDAVRLLLDVSAVPERPVGAGYYTLNIAAHLARRPDVETHLLCRQGDGARWEALAPEATRARRGALGTPGAPRVGAGARRPAWPRRSASTCGTARTTRCRCGSSVPAVVTVHDLTFFEHPEWHERGKVAYFRPMIRAACTTRRGGDRGERRHRAPAPGARSRRGPIVVAPHGVDHDALHSHGRRTTTTRRSRRTASAPPYVAFTGTIEPRKDLPTLVDAFARVAADNRPLRLVLAGGDGWGSDRVRDAVAASGVPTRVLRPGYLPDSAIAPLFRRAAVVAYPSLAEGFGLNALEALACGAPLVTTTGIRRSTKSSATPRSRVAPGDVDALGRRAARGARARRRRAPARRGSAARRRLHVGAFGRPPRRGVPAGDLDRRGPR